MTETKHNVQNKPEPGNSTKPLLGEVFLYQNLQKKDLEGEIWIDVLNYDGIFECSNFGRIKSLGRFVNIRNGQRWVKEKIRKQTLSKDGRLTCPLNGKSINVSATIFLSFYSTLKYNPKVECVIHKNKIQSDNRIENLEIVSISKSHSVNNILGLLPHLKINNEKSKHAYDLLTEKKCKICQNTKDIKKFKKGYNTCRNCQYLKKSSPNYRQFSEIKIKCLNNSNILIFKNLAELQKSKIISIPTFKNLMKSENKTFKSFKTKMNYFVISVS